MKARGYALLLILPVLVGVAVFYSLVTPVSSMKDSHYINALSDIRHRILAYSASYSESYNGSGAGPGHLPCPDTDPTPDGYKVQLGFIGDGPNPPCGQGSIAIGRLPRHITHANQRYAFHFEDRHDLWYAVDTRFINNPVNRVVSPDTLGRIHWRNQTQAVAVVFKFKEGSALWHDMLVGNYAVLRRALSGDNSRRDITNSVVHSVVITPAALLSVVSTRVALWLENQIINQNSANCQDGKPCIHLAVGPCAVSMREKLLLSMLDNANVLDCDQSSSDINRVLTHAQDAYLNGVSYRRHWFYRNRWWSYVDIAVDEACALETTDCQLSVRMQPDTKRLLLTVWGN